MSKDVTQLVMDRYFINELEAKINRDVEELNKRWAGLQERCDHPTIKVKDEYFSGGYDYVSEVRISHICTICDKVLKTYNDPKHKGYYG